MIEKTSNSTLEVLRYGMNLRKVNEKSMRQNQHLELIKQAPQGFEVNATKEWAKRLPKIDSFDDVFHLLEHPSITSQQEIRALYFFILHTFIYSEKILSGQQFAKLNQKSRSLHLFEHKPKHHYLDLKPFTNLSKVILNSCRTLKKISLPNTIDKISLLWIDYALKLEEVENLKSLHNVKALGISNSNKLVDFEFVHDLKEVNFLSLSANKTMDDIGFLKNHPNIVFLSLIGPNKIIKNTQTIDVLQTLSKLRLLNIAANQKERKILKEALPHL